MQALEKNIKGFNILEVLIVLVIIGVISAAALPNFNTWKKEREIRNAAVQIKDLINNITSQVQRGHYAFVQVHIEQVNEDDEDKLIITSKGIGMDQYAENLREVENWKTQFTVRCEPDPKNGWDDDGESSNKLEVAQIEFLNVMTEFADNWGTVCFSKDGTWYSSDGYFINSDKEVVSAFWICEKISDSKKCLSNADGSPDARHTNLFEIGWSRFGNITIEKWSGDEWVLQ